MKVRKKNRNTGYVIFGFLLFLVLFGFQLTDSSAKRVLFVSSYHPGFPTFFQQIDGIKSIFSTHSIDLDIEFMDSKRFYDNSNLNNFHDSLSYKLSRVSVYDLVLTADDNALSFALKYQEELFAGLPIIFFGVNNINIALEQNYNPKVTGTVEAVSMLDTLQLIKRLHPDTKRISALVDSTPSGQGDLKTFYSLSDEFDNIELSEISLMVLSFDEFAAQLRQVSDNTNIILLSAYKDKYGKNLLFHESLQLIKDNLTRPIYHLWYHGMGEGVLGGKLISHFSQGATAAEMALEVLSGRSVEDMVVSTESPNHYMFDYMVMKRFTIDKDDLPKESRVINRPFSFYEKYKIIVWSVLVAFTMLIGLVIALSLNIFRRHQLERELIRHRDHLEELVEDRTVELSKVNESIVESENKLQSILHSSIPICITNMEYQVNFSNNAYNNIFNINEHSKSPTKCYESRPGSTCDTSACPLKKILKGKNEVVCEPIKECTDGSKQYFIVTAKPFFNVRGQMLGIVESFQDITKRKNAEIERDNLIEELKKVLAEIKTLRGILPICSFCKNIRNDEGYYEQIEAYIHKHSGVDFSHTICPTCMKKHYPEEYEDIVFKKKS